MTKMLTLSALLAATTLLPMAAHAAEKSSKLECINLMSVDETPVINDHTILVKMKAGDVKYKRIDLAAPCTGIDFNGFSHRTGYNELCSSDTLTPRVTGGGVCKISHIVDISDNEAQDLMSQHKK
jgi:hypothetical protein